MRQEILRGALLLDKIFPGWESRIEIGKSFSGYSILEQLYKLPMWPFQNGGPLTLLFAGVDIARKSDDPDDEFAYRRAAMDYGFECGPNRTQDDHAAAWMDIVLRRNIEGLR